MLFTDHLEKSRNRPRDCSEIYKSVERSDGVYTVHIVEMRRSVDVYCDMTISGGGWTVCINCCLWASIDIDRASIGATENSGHGQCRTWKMTDHVAGGGKCRT